MQTTQSTQVVLKAAGGPDQLSVEQSPVPEPGPGQVLIRVEAAGVAFNDITTRQGRNPGPLPQVLGFDVVGEVLTVGSDVTDLRKGQRVAALLGTGGYSSHVAIDAASAVPVRSDVDAAKVDALVLNYVTAWQMLHRTAHVRPGQSVLVLGAAGGVGSALVELARAADITVYGTSSPGRRGSVEGAGARWVPGANELSEKVDAVFDAVGGPSLRASRQATRAGGVVVSYGFSFTVGAGHSKHGGSGANRRRTDSHEAHPRTSRSPLPCREGRARRSRRVPRGFDPAGGHARRRSDPSAGDRHAARRGR